MPAHTKPAPTASAVVSPTTVAALEKIPHAARRMGLSLSSFYRIAKRDGLRIIKVSERSSAVPQADVDLWIQVRLDLHANAVRAGKAVSK